MKTLELLLVVIAVSFVILTFIYHVSEIKRIVQQRNSFLERFYTGRYLIKLITEKEPYANGICNLTQNFFEIFNDSVFLDFLHYNNISIPVEIITEYLNGTQIAKIGGISENYLEFRRVCNHNGQLVLVRVRT